MSARTRKQIFVAFPIFINSSHSTLNSHTYAYNAGNQRTQQVFSAGSTFNYSYDKIGQLTAADSATNSEDRGYNYDAAWNLNWRTNASDPDNLDSFLVDDRNRLTNTYISYPGQDDLPIHDYTYDDNGNLTAENIDYGTYYRSLFYDDENRLTAIEQGSVRVEFTYDGLGRSRARTPLEWDYLGMEWVSAGPITCYVYDGMRVIQEREEFATPTVSYTRGTDLSGSLEGAGGIGGLLARSHGYSSGSWPNHNVYHSDGNGNITQLANSAQTSVAQYRYDPYGNLISNSGTLAGANKYRFSSKEFYDGAEDGFFGGSVGFYYYGYRFYAPHLQRWPNRDPLGERGGVNLYAFVANEPLSKIDPLGLSSKIYGDGQLCVDKKCKANMLTDLRYISETDPTRLLPLPAPETCVAADAFYAPGWAWKIPDNATLRIKCDDDGCISNITNNKLGIFGKRPTWEWDYDNNKPGPKPPKWPGDIPPYPNTPPKEEPPKN